MDDGTHDFPPARVCRRDRHGPKEGHDAVTPDDAADWQLRFQVQFLFPE